MTFEEALKELMKGKRVKHKDWDDYEYITTKGNEIVTQSGVPCKIIMDQPSKDCWEEYRGAILTAKEKEYLGAVIGPFRDRVSSIGLFQRFDGYTIGIDVKNEKDLPEDLHTVFLPRFKEGTRFKGMEISKYYTLEELGL